MRTFCGQGGGVLQLRTSALFGEKTTGFFYSFGVSEWTRGEWGEPVQTFCGQGGQFCGWPYGRRPHIMLLRLS